MNMPQPQFLSVGEGEQRREIAVLDEPGRGPAVVWLGGFRSDMRATKAEALAAWARAKGRRFVRFDYAGHGESGGDFAQWTLSDWLGDALAVLEAKVEGPEPKPESAAKPQEIAVPSFEAVLGGEMKGGAGGSAAKPAEAKAPEAKPAEAKDTVPKAPEAKAEAAKAEEPGAAEAKAGEPKPAELKPAELKPAEDKGAEAKSNEAKPNEAKANETKPAEPKPEEADPFSVDAIEAEFARLLGRDPKPKG